MSGEWHEVFQQWIEHDRFTYPYCFGCHRDSSAQPNFLRDLFAVQDDKEVMRLCKWCRRRWSKTRLGHLNNPFGFTLSLFRDEAMKRYPGAEIVVYRPTPSGLQPRLFTISDDD
jgi:hypothetical protein